MEDVLDLYYRPEDERHPLVCVDETSKQHLKETRESLPVIEGSPRRYDTEYARNGVSNLFMIFAPLQGFRHVEVTDQRTSIDFAHICRFEVPRRLCLFATTSIRISNLLCIKHFTLMKPGVLLKRLSFTIHRSMDRWLNIAEIEIFVLSRQCLSRRIPDQATLKHEIQAWQSRRNQQRATVKWQFTTDDARIKLKKLYPSVEC